MIADRVKKDSSWSIQLDLVFPDVDAVKCCAWIIIFEVRICIIRKNFCGGSSIYFALCWSKIEIKWKAHEQRLKNRNENKFIAKHSLTYIYQHYWKYFTEIHLINSVRSYDALYSRCVVTHWIYQMISVISDEFIS